MLGIRRIIVSERSHRRRVALQCAASRKLRQVDICQFQVQLDSVDLRQGNPCKDRIGDLIQIQAPQLAEDCIYRVGRPKDLTHNRVLLHYSRQQLPKQRVYVNYRFQYLNDLQYRRRKVPYRSLKVPVVNEVCDVRQNRCHRVHRRRAYLLYQARNRRQNRFQ